MRKRRVLVLALLLGVGWGLGRTAPASAADRRVQQLAPKYRQWLADVAILLRKEEREAFLAIREDYQRDGFIQKFWESRDPYPETPRNEFKETWYARLEEVRGIYGNITEDRARMILLHGPASRTWKTDCQLALWPLEIWCRVGGGALSLRLALASVRRPNRMCSFPASGFHRGALSGRAMEGMSATRFASPSSPYSLGLDSCCQP